MGILKKWAWRLGLALGLILLLLLGAAIYLGSLLGPGIDRQALYATRPEQLPYLAQALPRERGKILAVLTSTATLGPQGKRSGFELSELARAYYVFQVNGFEVEIASPLGGLPPMVRDDDDMGATDYAFLNDREAMAKLAQSKRLDQVRPEDYRAVYFVGGKGAMFDFPGHPAMPDLLNRIEAAQGVIGAVCHGPAALVNARRADGRPWVQGRRLSAFSNAEELFLLPQARELFPFLLQSRLEALGAVFEQAPMFLEQVSQDGRLITGQNPWSVWRLAEQMVQALGHAPLPRQRSAEERTVDLLAQLQRQGLASASERLPQIGAQHIDRRLLAMHALVAALNGEPGQALDLLKLLRRVALASR
jgi:putative intracellular protease/amidase